MNDFYNKELVFFDVDASNDIDIITFLSGELKKTGKIKDNFTEEVVKREKEYPTGIECGEINISVPHADYHLVNESSIAIAILKHPVKFRKMDNPEEKINVSIVIMLAIDQPHAHIDILKKVFTFIQNQELLKEIVNNNNHEIALKTIEDNL